MFQILILLGYCTHKRQNACETEGEKGWCEEITFSVINWVGRRCQSHLYLFNSALEVCLFLLQLLLHHHRTCCNINILSQTSFNHPQSLLINSPSSSIIYFLTRNKSGFLWYLVKIHMWGKAEHKNIITLSVMRSQTRE